MQTTQSWYVAVHCPDADPSCPYLCNADAQVAPSYAINLMWLK